MKDFVSFDLQSELSEEQVFACLTQFLKAFVWRRGDSDMQGPYIYGSSKDSVQINLWLGERPIAMSVSFRRAWPNVPNRETLKKELIDLITSRVIPSIGRIAAG